jgi:hypothetical protein
MRVWRGWGLSLGNGRPGRGVGDGNEAGRDGLLGDRAAIARGRGGRGLRDAGRQAPLMFLGLISGVMRGRWEEEVYRRKMLCTDLKQKP